MWAKFVSCDYSIQELDNENGKEEVRETDGEDSYALSVCGSSSKIQNSDLKKTSKFYLR
jgi:hypothetical protein